MGNLFDILKVHGLGAVALLVVCAGIVVFGQRVSHVEKTQFAQATKERVDAFERAVYERIESLERSLLQQLNANEREERVDIARLTSVIDALDAKLAILEAKPELSIEQIRFRDNIDGELAQLRARIERIESPYFRRRPGATAAP